MNDAAPTLEEAHLPDVEDARELIIACKQRLRDAPNDRAAVKAELAEGTDKLGWLAALFPLEWKQEVLRLSSFPKFASAAKSIDDAVKATAEQHRDSLRKPHEGPVYVEKLTVAQSLSVAAANVDPKLIVPSMFEVRKGGVWKMKAMKDGTLKAMIVCRTPIFIAAVGDDGTGGGTVHLRWAHGGAWKGADVPLQSVLVARELAALSQMGIPSSSHSAAAMVDYFDAYLICNADHLRKELVCSSLGWQKTPSGRAFLWGTTIIGDVDARPSSSLAESFPTVRGYREAGTMVGWRKLVDQVRDIDGFALALLASCCTPLIRLIPGAPNPILDFAGATSEGKTTALRVAASVWGLPDDRDVHGVVRTWDVTQTWLERAAGAMSDLPTLLDDSKRQEKADVTRSVVYSIAQGQGRGRGTIAGVQQTATWHTALISTGENPLSAHLRGHGGAQARVLTHYGSPFGGSSDAFATIARALRTGLLENFGHLGPLLVRSLLSDEAVASARAKYAAHVESWTAKAAGNAVAARRAEAFALLSTTLDILLQLGFRLADKVLDRAWDLGNEGAKEAADVGFAALRDVWGWAVANQHKLDGVGSNRNEFIGRAGAIKDGYAVAILAPSLREYLISRRYEAEAVTRRWFEKGWLHRAKDGRFAVSCRVGGAVGSDAYLLTHAALVETGCLDADVEAWAGSEPTPASTATTGPAPTGPTLDDDDNPHGWMHARR